MTTYSKAGPLAVGAIVSASWKTFRAFLRHWLALALPVFLVVDLIGAIALSESNDTARGIWAVAGVLATIVGSLLLQGALTIAAEDVTDGRVDVAADTAFAQARGRLPALFGTLMLVVVFFVAAILGVLLVRALLGGVIAGLLTAVVVVLGIIVAVRLAVLAPVVVLEKRSGRAAIERSWEITQGHWFLILRVAFLSTIIVGIPARLLGGIVSVAIPGFVGDYAGMAIPDALAAPLPALALVLTYFRIIRTDEPAPVEPVTPVLSPLEPSEPTETS